MNLKQLKIFYEVCKFNSITKASESLQIAQPSISLAIKELETYYNTTLFERMNRRIYITEAGKCLLSHTTSIINELNEAENALKNNEMISPLRIGANISLGSSLLPEVLRNFSSIYPSINTLTTIGSSAEIEKKLLHNDIDLAVVDNISVSSNLVSSLLFKENLIAVCGGNYPLKDNHKYTLQNLASEKLLLREKGSGLRNSIDTTFNVFDIEITPVVESASTTSLISCALYNLGVLIISKNSVEKYLMEGSLRKIPLDNITFLRNYYIVHHKNKIPNTPMKNFIIELKNTVNKR